jgi:putative Mg2+ transporter-C (MgtC) family protein
VHHNDGKYADATCCCQLSFYDMPESVTSSDKFIASAITIGDEVSIIGHVLFALVLGALIGLEREWKRKPAGFRTHAFVSAACAGVILIAPALVQVLSSAAPIESLKNEPLSLVQALFLGVGFIAGGLAIKDVARKEVLNLTTAATLLLASVVGMSVAAELYILAIALTTIVLLLNLIPWPFEQ